MDHLSQLCEVTRYHDILWPVKGLPGDVGQSCRWNLAFPRSWHRPRNLRFRVSLKNYGKVTILEWLSYKCISTYIHILDDAYAIIIHLHTWNTTTDVTFTNSSSEAPRNGSELCLTHREESTWLGRWRTGNKDLAVKIVIYPAKMVDLTWFNHQMLIKQIFSWFNRQQRVDQETNYLELHPRNRMCHITHIWLGYISNIIYIIFIYTYIYIYVDYN